MRISSNTIRVAGRLAVAAAVLAVAGCGAADDGSNASADPPATDAAGGGSATDDDVASLGTIAPDPESSSDDGSDGGEFSQADAEQAMLDFARCMREHGIDMPDPLFDGATGGVAIQAGGPGDSIDPEEMDAANTACQPIMDKVASTFEPPDPEQLEQMKQEALEFAQCMREHGIDMPDPQFGDQGQMTVSIGGDPGDPGSDDAPQFDPEEMEAASKECGQNGGFLAVSPAGPGDGPSVGVAVNVGDDG